MTYLMLDLPLCRLWVPCTRPGLPGGRGQARPMRGSPEGIQNSVVNGSLLPPCCKPWTKLRDSLGRCEPCDRSLGPPAKEGWWPIARTSVQTWSSVTMTVVTGTVHERLVVLKGLSTAL